MSGTIGIRSGNKIDGSHADVRRSDRSGTGRIRSSKASKLGVNVKELVTVAKDPSRSRVRREVLRSVNLIGEKLVTAGLSNADRGENAVVGKHRRVECVEKGVVEDALAGGRSACGLRIIDDRYTNGLRRDIKGRNEVRERHDAANTNRAENNIVAVAVPHGIALRNVVEGEDLRIAGSGKNESIG